MSGSVRTAVLKDFLEYVDHSVGEKRVMREAKTGVGKKSSASPSRGQARKTDCPTVFVGRPRREGSGEGWTPTPGLLGPINVVVTHVAEIADTPSSTIFPGAEKCVRMSFPRP